MRMKFIVNIFMIFLLIQSCKTTQSNSSKSNNQVIETNNYNKKNEVTAQSNGVDFLATGNTPTEWTLAIDIDDTVRFKADDGLNIKFAYNQLTKKNVATASNYTFTSKQGNFGFTIYDSICTIATEKQAYKKLVTFNFNSITYSGCGKYLANDLLQNKWTLFMINNIAINANDYNKIPELTFDFKNGKVSGNNGCNNISTNMEVQGNRILFGNFTTSKNICSKKSIATIVNDKLNNRLVSYFFKDGKLYLYLIDDSVLIFNKS